MTVPGAIIRLERAADAEAVRVVHEAAFANPGVARIVADTRPTDRYVPELSLVAEHGGSVVGHVLLSYADLQRDSDIVCVLVLGPIGVLPEHQNRGTGSALVRAGLQAAEARGEPLVALLGSPVYYSRFGFVLGSELGISAPPGDPPEHFQAVPLRNHDPDIRGTLFWHAAFTDNT
jgi:putative acetyltransferase